MLLIFLVFDNGYHYIMSGAINEPTLMYSYPQTCHRVDTAIAPNYDDIPEQLSMANSYLTGSQLDRSTGHFFKRRERLPLSENLWVIEAGAVRTYTLIDDGTIVTLGFWERGDTVGQPLASLQPYEVECLTDIKVRVLQPHECWNLNQVLSSHLQQTQALLRIRSGKMPQRLQQFLDWLAFKFGDESDRGQLIRLRLTHQDIADTLGTTRVTVTRLLNQFEQEGRIDWVKQHLLLPRKGLSDKPGMLSPLNSN